MDNLKSHISSFLTHIRIEKNFSENTEKSYFIILNIFNLFLNQNKYVVTDAQCIQKYIQHLKDKNNCDVTIANRLMVVKSFFGYLVKKKLYNKKTLAKIEKYKTTKKIISIPSDKEVDDLLKSIDIDLKEMERGKVNYNKRQKAKHYSLIRDLSFFTLLSATGLRISEALNIKLSDVNWQDHSILVTGKGAKERLIYFGSDRVVNHIEKLLSANKKYSITSNFMFVGFRSHNRLTSRCLQTTMKFYTEKLSIKKCTPHTLRHYYATTSIEKGANIKAISLLLGHSSIDITLKMYFHISQKTLRETFETKNPFSSVTATVDEIISSRYQMIVNI